MITSFLKEQSKRSRVHKPHHKSHSHKRGHRHRHSSESYLSDSEIGDGPRVSFLHDQGSKPFLKLHERYRAVNIKFFKRIYYGTFQPEHLTKLAHTFTNRSIDSRSKTKDEDVPEAIDLNQLIRCFCVYTAAVCHFAHSNVAVKLFQAFLDFRIKLSDWSIIYTFDTIREYLYAFMSARIAQGQDDPTAWEKEDQVLRRDILVRKDPFTSTKLTEDSNIL